MEIHSAVKCKLILQLSGNTKRNQIVSALLHFRCPSFYSNAFVVPQK